MPGFSVMSACVSYLKLQCIHVNYQDDDADEYEDETCYQDHVWDIVHYMSILRLTTVFLIACQDDDQAAAEDELCHQDGDAFPLNSLSIKPQHYLRVAIFHFFLQ